MLCLVTSGCHKRDIPKEKSTPIAVEVITVDSVAGDMTRTYVGEVQENASVAVSFATGGRIERVYNLLVVPVHTLRYMI